MLVVAFGLAQLGPVDGRPLYGYLSAFAIVVGAGLLVPAIMYGLARAGRRVLRRRLGVEGLLAHANLTSAIPRLSISVAALSVSLSMMVAIAIMIGSFRDTVVYWVGQTLQADLFVGPGHPARRSARSKPCRPDVIAAVQRHPAVDAIDSFRNLDLVYENRLTVLGAGTFDVVLAHGSLLFKSPANAREAVRQRYRPGCGDHLGGVCEPVTTSARATSCRCRPRRACATSRSRRSTTTTRTTAAW